MTAGDYIALALTMVSIGGVGIRLVVGMTRLVDAVERLSDASTSVMDRVEDHERRICQLEAGTR